VSIDEATRRVARLLRGAPTDGVDPAALPEPWRSLAGRIVTAEPGQRLEAFAEALAAQSAEDARALRLALIAVDPDEPPAADGADAPPAGVTGATGAAPPRLPFRTARELAAETPEVVEWVAEPWVALGCITELDGRPKTAGKTTWVLHLCKAVLDGAPFMGAPTRRSGVVYLTEQAPRSFRSTLERAGLLDRDDLLVLRWHDARGTAWPDVAAAAAAECRRRGYELLVVDTLPQFAGLRGESENSSGAALEAMEPLQDAAAAGIAVVMTRHDRKAGGDVGESGRGSSAFAGAVDVVLNLTRPEGNGPPTQRLLRALSRFEDTPDTTVIELTADGYAALGTERAVAAHAARAAILDRLPEDAHRAWTLGELLAQLATPDRPAPTRSTVQRALDDLTDGAHGPPRVGRTGQGRRNDPFRYWRLPAASAEATAERVGTGPESAP
jgi:hypothetical protein